MSQLHSSCPVCERFTFGFGGCNVRRHTTEELEAAVSAGKETAEIRQELAYREARTVEYATALLEGHTIAHCPLCLSPHLNMYTSYNIDGEVSQETTCSRCDIYVRNQRIFWGPSDRLIGGYENTSENL